MGEGEVCTISLSIPPRWWFIQLRGHEVIFIYSVRIRIHAQAAAPAAAASVYARRVYCIACARRSQLLPKSKCPVGREQRLRVGAFQLTGFLV